MKRSLLLNSAVLASVVFGATGALAGTLYVDLNSANPKSPFADWATAATNIQDAVDASGPGALVLVSNGVYAVGTRAVHGMSNRVAVTAPIVLRSVNGPDVTRIVGYQVPGTTNGAQAVRCVYLTNGATLAGFTLTNGATQSSGNTNMQESGGGVWCESVSAVVSNCVLTGNSDFTNGGGAYSGTLRSCTLAGNQAFAGGGAYSAALINCRLTGNSANFGGGAGQCTLTGCLVISNSVGLKWFAPVYSQPDSSLGGGAYSSTLNNCIVGSNFADSGSPGPYIILGGGGGAFGCTLHNCTLTNNVSPLIGGGAYSSTLVNCTVTPNICQYYGAGVGPTIARSATASAISIRYRDSPTIQRPIMVPRTPVFLTTVA